MVWLNHGADDMDRRRGDEPYEPAKPIPAGLIQRWIETGDRPPRHWWTRPGLFHWTNFAWYGPFVALAVIGAVWAR